MLLFYVLIISLPLTQHWLFGAGEGGLTVSKGVGLLCVPVAVLHLMRNKRRGGKVPGTAIAFTLYFVLLIVSWARHGNETSWDLLALQNVTSVLLLLWITLLLVDSPERLHRVLNVAVTGVAVASVYTIREWMAARAFVADYRPGRIATDANYFALCASAAVLLVLAMFQGYRRGWQKSYILGCLVVTTFAFSLAASRGGVIGLAAGLLVLLARSRARWRKIAIVGVLVFPSLMFAPTSVIRRFVSPGGGDNVGVEARQIAWNAGLRMIAANPLTGVGLARFRDVILHYEDPNARIEVQTLAHNTYIEVAAEDGLPIFMLLVMALMAVFVGLQRTIASSRRTGPRSLSDSALGLQAAFVSTMVCAFFLSVGWYRFFWFIPFLAAATTRIGRGTVITAIRARKKELRMRCPQEADRRNSVPAVQTI